MPGLGFKLLFTLSLTAGAIFVMWLAEQISLFGIGNGSSMIIFAGIVAGFPSIIWQTYLAVSQGRLSIFVASFIIGRFCTYSCMHCLS